MQLQRLLLLAASLAVLLVSVLPTDAVMQPVQRSRLNKLRRARRSARVSGGYFVHVKEEVSRERIESYTSELEGMAENDDTFVFETHAILDEAAHGFSARLSKKSLEQILQNDMVEFVDEDHYVHAGSQPNATTEFVSASSERSGGGAANVKSRVVFSWGLDRLDQTNSKKMDATYNPPCGLTGEGTDVYVLDSGIWYPHEEFDGKAVYPGCDPVDQVFGTNRSGLDCTGHGSHVAGTIVGKNVGVAPGATVFSVRILDCHNLGTANTILMGIDCVLKRYKQRKRPAIVNLSVYGEKDLVVKRAIDKLMKAGITVISIAGNNDAKPGDSCKLAPGSIQGVITTSASTEQDKAYVNSNAGVCVDLYAPGTNIKSASHLCNNCRSILKGSSMAAPHVTGAVALLLQKCPTISPWRVKNILLSQMVLPNKLDISAIPNKYRLVTPNLLLHTSSLQCDIQCH